MFRAATHFSKTGNLKHVQMLRKTTHVSCTCYLKNSPTPAHAACTCCLELVQMLRAPTHCAYIHVTLKNNSELILLAAAFLCIIFSSFLWLEIISTGNDKRHRPASHLGLEPEHGPPQPAVERYLRCTRGRHNVTRIQ